MKNTKSTKEVTEAEATKLTMRTGKKAAKKAVKAPAAPRKSHMFKLATKAAIENTFGSGQRAVIAEFIRQAKGATRAALIAALPAISPANISWHLSMMVREGTAKKVAA